MGILYDSCGRPFEKLVIREMESFIRIHRGFYYIQRYNEISIRMIYVLKGKKNSRDNSSKKKKENK